MLATNDRDASLPIHLAARHWRSVGIEGLRQLIAAHPEGLDTRDRDGSAFPLQLALSAGASPTADRALLLTLTSARLERLLQQWARRLTTHLEQQTKRLGAGWSTTTRRGVDYSAWEEPLWANGGELRPHRAEEGKHLLPPS